MLLLLCHAMITMTAEEPECVGSIVHSVKGKWIIITVLMLYHRIQMVIHLISTFTTDHNVILANYNKCAKYLHNIWTKAYALDRSFEGSMPMIVSNQKYCTLTGESSSLLIVMNIWESEPPLIMNTHCTLHTAEHNWNYYPFIFYGQCQWIRKTDDIYLYVCLVLYI